VVPKTNEEARTATTLFLLQKSTYVVKFIFDLDICFNNIILVAISIKRRFVCLSKIVDILVGISADIVKQKEATLAILEIYLLLNHVVYFG
jgi:hypothetical protein